MKNKNEPIMFKLDGRTWRVCVADACEDGGLALGHRSVPATATDLRAAGWVPAEEAVASDTATRVAAEKRAEEAERREATAVTKCQNQRREIAGLWARLEREREENRAARKQAERERDEAVEARNTALAEMATQARQAGRLQSTLDAVREQAEKRTDDACADTELASAYHRGYWNGAAMQARDTLAILDATPPADDAKPATAEPVTRVIGCVRCGKPAALCGDVLPADELCPWCRGSGADCAPRASAARVRDVLLDAVESHKTAGTAEPPPSEHGRREGVRLTEAEREGLGSWVSMSKDEEARTGYLPSASYALRILVEAHLRLDAGNEGGGS